MCWSWSDGLLCRSSLKNSGHILSSSWYTRSMFVPPWVLIFSRPKLLFRKSLKSAMSALSSGEMVSFTVRR